MWREVDNTWKIHIANETMYVLKHSKHSHCQNYHPKILEETEGLRATEHIVLRRVSDDGETKEMIQPAAMASA